MSANDRQLMEKIAQLPPDKRAEVADFVDFLAAREERAAAAQRLTEALQKIDALGLPPIPDEEVEEEVQASRRERQARQGA